MTALPTTTTAFASGATEAQFKSFLADLRDYLAVLLGTDGLPATARTALGVVNGVSSFNSRTGAVTLQQSDITSALVAGALGYTPAHVDTAFDWQVKQGTAGTTNLRDNYGYGIYYVWSSSSPSNWTYGIVIVIGGVYGVPDYPSIGMTSGGGNVPVVLSNIGFTGSGLTSGNVQKLRKL